MSLNDTPSANRIHIGLFGRRNAGKSSLINALTGQEVAIVSDIAGTTTDPVSKAMELLPLGPVVLVDTPGLDDDSELGKKRVKKGFEALEKIDIGLVVIDASIGRDDFEDDIEQKLQHRSIPYLLVYNKTDLNSHAGVTGDKGIPVSALTGEGINELKNRIGALTPEALEPKPLVSDLLGVGDTVLLVVPVDSGAPKGRLILPQQQTIRDILDSNAQAMVTKDDAVTHTLGKLAQPPRLVITDSQVFESVKKQIPEDLPLTSFSILMARYKGILSACVSGIEVVAGLKDGDTLLICEGCTHHRQCEDIGTVKLPRMIQAFTGKTLNFQFASGGSFHDDLSSYALIVHCGACMLQEKVMKHRLALAVEQGVPITNYGILIAHIQGILKRSLEPLHNK